MSLYTKITQLQQSPWISWLVWINLSEWVTASSSQAAMYHDQTLSLWLNAWFGGLEILLREQDYRDVNICLCGLYVGCTDGWRILMNSNTEYLWCCGKHLLAKCNNNNNNNKKNMSNSRKRRKEKKCKKQTIRAEFQSWIIVWKAGGPVVFTLATH